MVKALAWLIGLVIGVVAIAAVGVNLVSDGDGDAAEPPSLARVQVALEAPGGFDTPEGRDAIAFCGALARLQTEPLRTEDEWLEALLPGDQPVGVGRAHLARALAAAQRDAALRVDYQYACATI